MKTFAATILGLFLAGTAFAQLGKPEHSQVEAQVSSGDGKALVFTFTVKPDADMQATLDAPWKLKLEGEGLSFAKSELKRPDMDDKLPGWRVQTTEAPKAAKGELSYQLTAFVCTKDKSRCYREVHKGKVPWGSSAE